MKRSTCSKLNEAAFNKKKKKASNMKKEDSIVRHTHLPRAFTATSDKILFDDVHFFLFPPPPTPHLVLYQQITFGWFGVK